jgi:predicted transcriptional regulator of viral defense system
MPAESGYASTPPMPIGARLAAAAAEQRGVVSRRQLEQLGNADATITALVGRGRLCRIWPGVYAHGHAVLTRDGWMMAAALACGDGAQLAGRASAAARGLLTARSVIDVITPTQRGVALDGIRAHRACLLPEERDTHRGLPVTSLARTALDVAAWERPDRVGELLDNALLDGQYDHAEMLGLIAARRGSRGMAILRQAVAVLGDQGTVFRSRPERLARDLLREAELPEPAVNGWFATRAGYGHELDLWWPGRRLNFEVDGPHHLMPHQRRLDALRDRDLRSFGVRVERVRDTVVLDQPARFVAAVRRILVECG